MIVVEVTNISTVDALSTVWKLREAIPDLSWAMHHELENGFALRSMRILFQSEEQAVMFLMKHGDRAKIVEKELT